MHTLISILLPSVIGVKIIEHINKVLSLKSTAYYYLILLTLSTILNSLISFFCFKVEDTINLLNKSTIYFCQYTSISIVINILLSLIFVVIIKNISFNIEVKENVRKSKKNTKKN